MKRTTLTSLVVMILIQLGCGREPSRLLRQGQLPIYDFPLYLSEGVAGRVWKIDRDRNKTLVAQGLNDPRGVATDRFQNVYIAEYGAGRILKVKPDEDSYTVFAENLSSPSVVAVDSFGDVFVAQDGDRSVTRLSDKKIFGSYETIPTALAFGVDDQPIVGLFNENKVLWGWQSDDTSATIAAPINASIDGTGRIYVAQGDPENGQVMRYHQREPGEGTLVADNILGPTGIAVDLVGNIFLVEQGAGRIVLITFDGKKYAWIDDVEDPQYLAFTQY